MPFTEPATLTNDARDTGAAPDRVGAPGTSGQDDLLTLSLVDGLGPTLVGRAIETMGSAASVLTAGAADLEAVRGIGRAKSAEIRRGIDEAQSDGRVEREKQLMLEHGVTMCTPGDAHYPALLRHIPDPPPLLFMRGRIEPDDAVALAVVGSRRCSHYGREQCGQLVALCCRAGLCIVSGGAYGIDSVAHRAPLRSGGRTIAVIGSGLARPYPSEHRALFDEIAAGRGAVVSEFAMTFPPLPENFPRRNRIISGLSLGVLVIEAAARSGALITARLCAEEHGREVMALPGRVDSKSSAGCHKMVREGWATIVTGLSDVLDALGETGQLLKTAEPPEPPDADAPSPFTRDLTDTQQRILAVLDEPRSSEHLAAATGLPMHVLQADLTMLELRSAVEKRGPMFVRRR